MASSFGVVEEKLREAEFFVEQMRECSKSPMDARFFFSAFVSAARSVTFALQASLRGVEGFDTWYEGVRKNLKEDPLAPHFVKIRNDVVHQGVNPVNRGTFEHHVGQPLRDDRSQFLFIPFLDFPSALSPEETVSVNANDACTTYFRSLVELVFGCYRRFKAVVDPQWYFTKENFVGMERSLHDAVHEMDFPPDWLDAMPEDVAWRLLRGEHSSCPINGLFNRYLGKTISAPDAREGQ